MMTTQTRSGTERTESRSGRLGTSAVMDTDIETLIHYADEPPRSVPDLSLFCVEQGLDIDLRDSWHDHAQALIDSDSAIVSVQTDDGTETVWASSG